MPLIINAHQLDAYAFCPAGFWNQIHDVEMYQPARTGSRRHTPFWHQRAWELDDRAIRDLQGSVAGWVDHHLQRKTDRQTYVVSLSLGLSSRADGVVRTDHGLLAVVRLRQPLRATLRFADQFAGYVAVGGINEALKAVGADHSLNGAVFVDPKGRDVFHVVTDAERAAVAIDAEQVHAIYDGSKRPAGDQSKCYGCTMKTMCYARRVEADGA